MDSSKQIDDHRTDWQILGELELPVALHPDDAIRDWLAEILSPLNLSTGFFNRFLKSAQASVMQALGEHSSIPLGHIQISILVLQKRYSAGKSWGFFQIERIDMKVDDADFQHYAIDYYLYVEDD